MTAISKRRSSTRTPRTRRRRPSVELLETRQLLTTFVVSNPNDSGRGTLRTAITDSNADTAQTNLITFDLGTSGIQTIDVLSPLPAITQPVTIDGNVGGGLHRDAARRAERGEHRQRVQRAGGRRK